MAFYGSVGVFLFQARAGRVSLRIGYRVRQFLTALSFGKESIDESKLRAYLSPAQVELFRRMPTAEQRHACATLRTLQKEGHSETALAQAALLHDVGRTGGHVRLWHRVATVLLQALAPALLQRIARDEPGSRSLHSGWGWRYPFTVQLQHASRGADMAAEVGTDPLAVALIRWHHSPVEESGLDKGGQALLTALKSADEQN